MEQMQPKPFAAVADLAVSIAPDMEPTAEKLIQRASRLIRDECGDAVDPDSARDVCCSMVERAWPAFSAGIFGVGSSSMSAGGYQESFSYINAAGEVYLLDKERDRLKPCDAIGFC